MDHLQLAFGCEGGGGGGSCVETPKWTTSSSRLDAREVVVVAGIGIHWEWPVEDKNGENKPRLSSWLVFTMHLLPPRFYPPLDPCSLRVFAHADEPTSLMRGEGHLSGGIPVVVVGGGGKRRRDTITKFAGRDQVVIMCGHDHMTC